MGFYSTQRCVQTGSGHHTDSYSMDIVGLPTGVKWLKSEADHSIPSNAKVKNAWRYTSTPSIGFHRVVLN
jgi:hypothetical protein